MERVKHPLTVPPAPDIPPRRANAGDVQLLHRHVNWIVPVLELSLVAAVVPYIAGIAAARRLGAAGPMRNAAWHVCTS
ncbi:MAG TPA: hypothetical protein VNO25_20590 [Streptosporangiaceae bacterium]|nr:hypothetical protein [Streptosporangiaceae bacterium]